MSSDETPRIVAFKPRLVENDPCSAVNRNKKTIDILEQALAEAKEGSLLEVAFAGVYENGDARTAFTPSDNFHLLSGVITLLQAKRMKSFLESNDCE